MSARDGSRRRVLSYEERVLWTAVTKAIEPLRVPVRPFRRGGCRDHANANPSAPLAKTAQASPPPAPAKPSRRRRSRPLAAA